MNVILTIFVAGIVIFVVWFLIVLRVAFGAGARADDDKEDAGPDNSS